MKNKKFGYIFASAVVAALVVVGVGFMVSQSRSTSAENTCKGVASESHQVMIMDSKASPDHVTGKVCDTITITNMDNVAREIAFGPHEDHVAYDGVAEKVLNLGQKFTITLNKTGSYHYHDHLHDEVEGFFTVTK